MTEVIGDAALGAQLVFEEQLKNWLNAVQTQVMDTQVNTARYEGFIPYVLKTEEGRVFVRIVSCQGDTHRSAWAFVAKQDGETKFLGKFHRGDIFKSATWKAPAKHARGNIFADTPLCGIQQWTGPNYLK